MLDKHKHPEHWLVLNRVVRFGETDAAGVIHFYNLLRWSHEAWEESLQKYGLQSSEIFPQDRQKGHVLEISFPIYTCKADFRKPITVGDQLEINLFPKKIDMSSFQVKSQFRKGNTNVAFGLICHVAINNQTRKRCILPENINLWLEASSVNMGPSPL